MCYKKCYTSKKSAYIWDTRRGLANNLLQREMMFLRKLILQSIPLFIVLGSSLNADVQKAYFAGGCFWGVEYHFEKLEGVKSVVSGFMGGHIENPSYRDVVRGKSGHLEVVEVTYDPLKVSFETLAKLFFEIHDPTQKNGQGPDIGSQYLSAIFTSDKKEKETIYKLVGILDKKGLEIATKIYEAKPFYKAEDYHQDYYEKTGKKPYCHSYKKLF